MTISMASPAASTQLSSELTDAIIDHLRTDCRTLVVCSAVCRRWLPRSRYHLFDNANVCLRHSNHNDFFDLQDSPVASLVPYVRHLTLRDERGGNWIARALSRLTALTAVKSLELNQVQFEISTISTLFSAFKELESLRMYHVYFGSLADVMCVLGTCAHLEHIELDRVGWDFSEEPSAFHDQRPLIRLRSLALGECDKEAVVKWLYSRPIPAIEALRLSLVRKAPTQLMHAFLTALGPSLKSFSLGFATAPDDFGAVERVY
jgi:hypothetical protein